MMKHAFGLFKRKEKKVKLVDADSELDHEFREGLQDAVEAKAQYEELLRVATRTAQQAQGFAQSQQDLAACFVETLGNVDDSDIADCFKRLGRVQGEIAKLLDNYSGHLNETIIKPTEELQHKLEQMEASRKVFEEKKQACEALKARTARSKRRSWGQNGEEPLDDQATLQAQDDFDDAFMSLGQQLMAVEQCRPKILFEQAARLHAAQMTLFTRALGNVHTIEPYIKDLSVQKNIDRRLPNGDGYSEHDDDDERSDADSVEHPPPSAWDDDFDSRGSSPTAHLEIKDLPQEMPAEWSALLHGLDQTLQEMGEQTLDTKDAVFAVNALLMASTEGKRQQMSDHMYHRSHSGPLSLNTHSGSRSAPLSSTGVPLHLLNAAQASGGQNPGPKTPPREEADPPGKETIHAGARKPNLQIQVGGKVGTMSKSGPLTPTGVPAAMGSQPGTQTAATPSTTSRTPAPLTRSSGSRGSSFRAAKSGPVFPISAPAGGFGQPRQGYGQGPRSLSHHFSTQQGSSSLVELGTTKSFAGPPTVQNNKPRNSSIYASKSGPIIMTQPRGIPLTPTGGAGASLPAHSIPYSLPTEASQGPPRISPDPIIPKSGPIGRSPLAKSSISPNTSPPLSPPRNSPPLQDELYQLPAPPIQVGSAPTGGGHFLAGGPLVRSAEPVLPNSSGISGSGPEGDGPSPLPPPPSGGKVLLRRNSRDRSEPSINGGNGLMINIPPQQIHHTKSARTRPMPQTPLSPISPSEDGMSTPSPSRPPNSVGPLYLVHALNNGALEESHIRRSMSFEGVPQTSKAPPPAPTSGDPPRRSPVPPMSPERPLVTISSPLPAMPPSTPPERPESQGALNALAGQEREELIKAVNSENFRWKYVEEAPFKGPKQVPELETLEPDQRERLLQTLARAVKSRREAFIDEHTHGFSDLPSDLLVQETC